MIALKVERIGDQVAVVLSAESLAALNVKPGDTVNIEAQNAADPTRSWVEDPHARGRAFLKRYTRALDRNRA